MEAVISSAGGIEAPESFEYEKKRKKKVQLSSAYFFNPRREVLNEQLAQVVEGLEFAGLGDRQMETRSGRQLWTL